MCFLHVWQSNICLVSLATVTPPTDDEVFVRVVKSESFVRSAMWLVRQLLLGWCCQIEAKLNRW